MVFSITVYVRLLNVLHDLHLYPIFMNENSGRDRAISPSPLLVINLISAAQIYDTSFINLQRSKISQWNDNKQRSNKLTCEANTHAARAHCCVCKTSTAKPGEK